MPRSVMKSLPLAGSVNRLVDQRFIKDEQCVQGLNLAPTRAGMAAKRLAIDSLTPAFSGGDLYTARIDLPPANFGNGFVFSERRFDGVSAAQTTVYVSPQSPITAIAAASWAQPSKYRPLVLSYNKRIYTFAGANNLITSALTIGATTPVGRPGAIIQEVSPGGALEVVAFDFLTLDGGVPTELNAAPNVAAVYRNRTLWADFGPGFENYAVLSDPYLPQVVGANFLAANGRWFQIGARDGDRIVAGREIMQTAIGAPSEAALLVLRQYSGYVITGEPNLVVDGTFVLGDMNVNRINTDCGCSSADTLVNTPYGLLWAGWDDVWFFPQGSVPQRVGSNIRSVLQATPPELRYLWHASYFDGFYRLHLLSAGQNEGDRTRPGEEWRLDLRYGPPRTHDEARWHGPIVYRTPNGTATADVGVAAAVADTRPGVVPRLIGMTRSGGSASEPEHLVQFELNAPRDFQSLDVEAAFGAGSLLQDTEILLDWQGKEDDFTDPMVEKGYAGVELNFWTSHPAQLTVEDLIDGGRTSASDIEVLPATGFILDISLLDTDLLTREFQSVAVDVDEDTRPNGKTHQFRLYDQAGYLVTDENDEMDFIVRIAGVDYDVTASLTQGLYDTKVTLLDHIVIQMGAAATLVTGVTLTFSHNQGTNPEDMVELTISANEWRWTFFDNNPKSQQVYAMLGYDLDNPPAVAGAMKAATTFIFLRMAAMLEFAAMNAKIYSIKRRAT